MDSEAKKIDKEIVRNEKDCTFCQIIRGEKSADILYHDESLVVFKDAHPHAPVHLLILPKKHIRSLNDLVKQDKNIISEHACPK